MALKLKKREILAFQILFMVTLATSVYDCYYMNIFQKIFTVVHFRFLSSDVDKYMGLVLKISTVISVARASDLGISFFQSNNETKNSCLSCFQRFSFIIDLKIDYIKALSLFSHKGWCDSLKKNLFTRTTDCVSIIKQVTKEFR